MSNVKKQSIILGIILGSLTIVALVRAAGFSQIDALSLIADRLEGIRLAIQNTPPQNISLKKECEVSNFGESIELNYLQSTWPSPTIITCSSGGVPFNISTFSSFVIPSNRDYKNIQITNAEILLSVATRDFASVEINGNPINFFDQVFTGSMPINTSFLKPGINTIKVTCTATGSGGLIGVPKIDLEYQITPANC